MKNDKYLSVDCYFDFSSKHWFNFHTMADCHQFHTSHFSSSHHQPQLARHMWNPKISFKLFTILLNHKTQLTSIGLRLSYFYHSFELIYQALTSLQEIPSDTKNKAILIRQTLSRHRK